MDRLQVCASRGRAKYFLIQTELTKSTSILSYGGVFLLQSQVALSGSLRPSIWPWMGNFCLISIKPCAGSQGSCNK